MPVCPKCGEPVEPAPSVCRACGHTIAASSSSDLYTLDVPTEGTAHVDPSVQYQGASSRRGCAVIGGVLVLVVSVLTAIARA